MDYLPYDLQEVIIIKIITENFHINNIKITYISKNFIFYIHKFILNYLLELNFNIINFNSYSFNNLILFYICLKHPVHYQKTFNPFLFRNPYVTNCLKYFTNKHFNFALIITNTNLEKYILNSIFSNYFKQFNQYNINLINFSHLTENINNSSHSFNNSHNLVIININQINDVFNKFILYFDIIFPFFYWNVNYNYLRLLLNVKNINSSIICINDIFEGIF